MALLPPAFLDCVVAIGIKIEGKETQWVASGFLYGHFLNKQEDGQSSYRVFLITNRHVFSNLSNVLLKFNPTGEESAKEYPVDLIDKEGKPIWFTHEDSEIDVAILRINAQVLLQEGIQFSIFTSEGHAANIEKLKELGITEGDGLFILGFPMGLVGTQRNFVIVRNGTIARISDALSRKAKSFIIDASIFPGNSGGPVVSKPEMLSIEGTKGQNSSFLIGIVSGYLPYQDVAISAQTGKTRIVFEENSGLTVAHPIDFVQEIIVKNLEKTE